MFNGDFSREEKDGVYVKNFDDKQSKATNWASLFTDKNTAVYFDSFGIEYIPQKVLKLKRRQRQFTTHNIFRMQVDDCVMSGFFLHCFHRIYDCRKNAVRLYLFLFSK